MIQISHQTDYDSFRPILLRWLCWFQTVIRQSIIIQTRHQAGYGDSRVIRQTNKMKRVIKRSMMISHPSSGRLWWFQTRHQAVCNDFRLTIGHTVIILFLDSSLDSLGLFQTAHQANLLICRTSSGSLYVMTSSCHQTIYDFRQIIRQSVVICFDFFLFCFIFT